MNKQITLTVTNNTIDLDDLVKDSLLSDYYSLNDDISNFYDQYENVLMEDIPIDARKDQENHMKYRDALEILLEYYLTADEYNERVLEIE